ncbi:MAG: ImmA/IrrE family metallo-endopeptidase, partial [Leptolyngbyaceae bacterium]|nr:ImmA/IrrE family metallo-endopeptidase [Leptolyngbyaceae bacterium]
GLSKPFVRECLLPEWWANDVEAEPDAVVTAAAYVSRRANLDFASLIQNDCQPHFKEALRSRYKVNAGGSDGQLALPQAIASQVANLVAFAWSGSPYDPSKVVDPQAIRDHLLQRYPVVTLEGLTRYCLSCGIPVVHVSQFPEGQKKFDGMVGYFGDRSGTHHSKRPVIVIRKNHKSPAWLAFIVAHELGHIGHGHIQDVAIVDEQINPNKQSNDQEEVDATEFGLEILFGKTNPCYYQLRHFKAEELAQYAKKKGQPDRIDPGSIILNYAWYKAEMDPNKRSKQICWATAQKALNYLAGEADANAPKLINGWLSPYLDRDRLSNDNQEFLERMVDM